MNCACKRSYGLRVQTWTHSGWVYTPALRLETGRCVPGVRPWGHFFAGWALERLGRGAEAVAALREAVRYSSNSPVMLAGLGHALAVLQDRREAKRVATDLERLRGNKGLFAYELGVIRAALGERNQAFTWLERAVKERSGWIAYLRVDPRLDNLYADPRFDSLVAYATAVRS
jgi:tetratricopeptide (TPR) repeat protein